LSSQNSSEVYSINSGSSIQTDCNQKETKKSGIRYDSMDAMRSRLSIIKTYDKKFNSNHTKWLKITSKGFHCEACGKTLKDSYKVFEANDKVRIMIFINS
jgi:hypothetical protein